MKYRDIARILLDHGFALKRQEESHRQFEGFVDGRRHLVTLAFHGAGDDIAPKILASIIRQSGQPRRAFR